MRAVTRHWPGPGTTSWQRIAYSLIGIGIGIAIATTLSWFLVERPMRDLRKRVEARRPRSEVSAGSASTG